jgi:SAM-dependent methyltransferase
MHAIFIAFIAILFSFRASAEEKTEMQEFFEHIYYAKIWGEGSLSSEIGGSGGGSTIAATRDVREYIVDFLSTHPEVQTFLDVGCGEAIWQMLIPWEEYGVKYIGLDVVEPLIKINQEKWAHRPGVEFIFADGFTKPLPQADVCFIKDVLQHWNDKQIRSFVQKIRNDYHYLMVINGKDLFDITRLQLEPYAFGKKFTDSPEIKHLYFIFPK